MASFRLHPDNLQVRARVDAHYQTQRDRQLDARVATTLALIDIGRRHPWLKPIFFVGAVASLYACTRSASTVVIPSTEGSPTPEPSHTPTGTAEPTGTYTAIATLSAPPPPATETLIAPPPSTTEAPPFFDANGDGIPDFPDIDPNNDGVDRKEMASGVQAVAEWVNDSLRVLADGKSVSPMIEQLAHLFGHTDVSLRAELAASSDKPFIDLPWMADADIGRDGVTTAAEHLYWRSGVGVLTTGESLNNMFKVLAPQIHVAGQLLDDPDSKVTSFADLEKTLANSLGVDSDPRAGIQPSPAGELGLNKDLCLNVAFDEGSGQDRPTLNIPVVVEATVKPGNEFMDTEKRIHVSNKSAIAVVLRVVENGELPAIQQLLRAEGDAATVTKLSPNYSLLTEAFLVEDNPQIAGSQILSCGRPAQGGAQQPVTPTPTVIPSATETPRPQGGGQPPATEVPLPLDTLVPPTRTPVPSVTPTPRPNETPVPPTSTPVVPTATPGQPATEIPSRTPLPTVTPPDQTETPPLVETPKETLTQLPTPVNSPTSSAPN